MTVQLSRRVIHQLRASLERDAGPRASAYLKEAGFAGGADLYDAFAAWLRRARGIDEPGALDLRYFSDALGAFFADMGWGTLTATAIHPAVTALDTSQWAEAVDGGHGEHPSCHLTCGMLADFFGRIAGGSVAVMEVECRSRGDHRCRFLVGASESLGALYEHMAQGTPYLDVLAANAPDGGVLAATAPDLGALDANAQATSAPGTSVPA